MRTPGGYCPGGHGVAPMGTVMAAAAASAASVSTLASRRPQFNAMRALYTTKSLVARFTRTAKPPLNRTARHRTTLLAYVRYIRCGGIFGMPFRVCGAGG